MKRPIRPTPELLHQLPPQDLALEAAVLGAAILEAPALRKALELLPDPDVFYKSAHAAIWQAIRELFQAGTQIDLLTVINQLRASGKLEQAGGLTGVHALVSKVSTGAHVETHCRLLQQLYARRLTQQAARQLLSQAADEMVDPLELFADAQHTLTRLTRSISTRRAESAAALYDDTLAAIFRAHQSHGLTGLPTGYRALDGLTGGWQPGNLIIVAGRPGMGKTTAALDFAAQAALAYHRRVLFVSLEMPARELMLKLVAREVGRTTFELAHGKLPGGVDEVTDLYHAAAPIQQATNLLIDPSAALTVGQLRARAAELKAEPAGLDLIIVDYLQLLRPDTRTLSREEQVAEVSRSLKALALELAIPVIALAQLNREVEKRADKRPTIGDLRESGQIEQDADLILFPWRGEYYGITEYDDGTATQGTILLDVQKHRNGPVGEILLACDIARGRLRDPADPPHTWRPDRESGHSGGSNQMPESAFEAPATTFLF